MVRSCLDVTSWSSINNINNTLNQFRTRTPATKEMTASTICEVAYIILLFCYLVIVTCLGRYAEHALTGHEEPRMYTTVLQLGWLVGRI